MDRFELPPVFTLRDLSKLLDITKFRVRSFLRDSQIKPRRVGNKFVVYLSQIKARNPELYESLEVKVRFETVRRWLDESVESVKKTNEQERKAAEDHVVGREDQSKPPKS